MPALAFQLPPTDERIDVAHTGDNGVELVTTVARSLRGQRLSSSTPPG